MNKQLESKMVKAVYFEEYSDADKVLAELVNEKLKCRMREMMKKGLKPTAKKQAKTEDK